MKVHDVIQRPLVTEKSNLGRNPDANKHDIQRAVESLFGVDVVRVRTMRQPRKKKRVGRIVGRTAEWKKAIVELAEGQSIEFFEGV
jgi:large subunit ribosomal protein L23